VGCLESLGGGYESNSNSIQTLVRGHRGGESESDSECMHMCICGWVFEERELEFPFGERERARRRRREGGVNCGMCPF